MAVNEMFRIKMKYSKMILTKKTIKNRIRYIGKLLILENKFLKGKTYMN